MWLGQEQFLKTESAMTTLPRSKDRRENHQMVSLAGLEWWHWAIFFPLSNLCLFPIIFFKYTLVKILESASTELTYQINQCSLLPENILTDLCPQPWWTLTARRFSPGHSYTPLTSRLLILCLSRLLFAHCTYCCGFELYYNINYECKNKDSCFCEDSSIIWKGSLKIS